MRSQWKAWTPEVGDYNCCRQCSPDGYVATGVQDAVRRLKAIVNVCIYVCLYVLGGPYGLHMADRREADPNAESSDDSDLAINLGGSASLSSYDRYAEVPSVCPETHEPAEEDVVQPMADITDEKPVESVDA